MSARRPSLQMALRAMELYPVDRVADENLASALRLTVDIHTPEQANADRHGRYGRCRCCGQWWPCPAWCSAEQAARVWLWEAAQTVIARYRARKRVAA